jgi:uncharacterized protein (TIGR00299 family) protein
MRRLLWFDSVGGASGDMILAALIDLGADVEALNTALAALGTAQIRLTTHPHSDHGMHGLRVHVEAHEHAAGHAHGHAHAHADTGHAHHRHLPDIRRLIESAALPAATRQRATAVFARLAEAEARVHRTAPDRIHFHEVGALDAIADITGACHALELLGIDAVGCSPLPMGHGTITCAHGVMPNPAPGTVELLKGLPVVSVDEPFELVTPTGAALLSTWRSLDTLPAGAVLQATGHGFGTRTLQGRPNLLRVTLFETVAAAADDTACLVIETNLDDTAPELVGALLQRLMAAGAYDAFATGIQMKKQRPGVLLTVLCAPDRRAIFHDLIFRESTTFGLREHLTHRTMLAREIREVTTPHGTLRIKVGRWQGKAITASPEYEDCVRCADAAGVAVRIVYEAAAAAARSAGLLDTEPRK